MTGDHTFIDAHGNKAEGKKTMKAAWESYFNWFPDYRIEIVEIFEDGNSFAALGGASGTYEGKNPNKNYWKLPAAWRVIVENERIKLWQVYADTKIPFDIIEKSGKNH
jgi:hypothetical protein